MVPGVNGVLLARSVLLSGAGELPPPVNRFAVFYLRSCLFSG